MDRAKRARRPVRATITKVVNDVDHDIQADDPDLDMLEDKLGKLHELLAEMKQLDQVILDEILNLSNSDDLYEFEHDAIGEYEDKIRSSKRKITKMLRSRVDTDSINGNSGSGRPGHSEDMKSVVYRLPKIEMQKYNGDMKDWLNWWSQFKRVHEDTSLHASDKFQYLMQATVEGSRARKLVEGYPQTPENYPKVVDALHDRFGDKTLLTEFYVRQLAKLVISNANQHRKTSLSNMYDHLEASIRSLESLGVTSEHSAAFLYPLVESSLPEETLKVWQRSSLAGYNEDGEEKSVDSRLQALMKFLKQEVKGEQRMSYVNDSFYGQEEVGQNEGRRKARSRQLVPSIPTAASLLSQVSKCVFCDRNHESKECVKGGSMKLEERKKIVEQKRCCYVCLKQGHMAKNCRAFAKCIVCGKKHYVIMCPNVRRQEEVKDPEVTNLHLTSTSLAILQTLRMKVKGPNGEKVVRALVDTGAQKSYILSQTANDIGLAPVKQLKLRHGLFGGTCSDSQAFNQFSLEISHVNGLNKVILPVLGHSKICSNLPPISAKVLLKQLKNHGIVLSDDRHGGEIEVLLGADSCASIFTTKMRKITQTVMAVETKFGWTVLGNPSEVEQPEEELVAAYLSFDLEDFWKLETIGIGDGKLEADKNCELIKVQKQFKNGLSRDINNRYVVSLPWISEYRPTESNISVAIKRMWSCIYKLKSKCQMKCYSDVFKSWEAEGLIEKVKPKTSLVFYLPHRPVFKPESTTTPVRPVFDGSCRNGPSPAVNDLLHKGPNLIAEIPELLVKFRANSIGVTADIRKAFQTIGVREDERDYFRFLWIDQDERICEFRHTRVVFGINASPFLLGAVLNHHLSSVEDNRKEVASQLLHALYVDNVVTSVRTEEELVHFRKHSVQLLAEAQMVLREWYWTTVEDSGVGSLLGSECGLGSGSVSTINPKVTMILGTSWDYRKDVLAISVPKMGIPKKITKREILAAVAKIFDPIGFTAPTTLLPKLWLQNMWTKNHQWDTEAEPIVLKKFTEWMEQLKYLTECQIPRHLGLDLCDPSSLQLHTFCDASVHAYAAVVFVRVPCGNIHQVKLVLSKSRVAPLNKLTIPRLELMSCLIGARLCQKVLKSFSFEKAKKIYWTDSSTALAWIKKAEPWSSYVGNRVSEIRSLSNVEHWRHVAGINNPADLPSRGCQPLALLESKWWEGPRWLKSEEKYWPVSNPTYSASAIEDEKRKVIQAMVTTNSPTYWYCNRYSNYLKNLRMFTWVVRFILKIQRKSHQKGNLTLKELIESEMKMMKLVQKDAFQDEMKNLNGIKIVKDNNGVFRVETKLLNRQDAEDFIRPILLPSCHPFVEQYVTHFHVLHCHAGMNFLLSKLREVVWIVKSRKTVLSVLRKCLVCRRFTSKAVTVDTTPLPEDRVKDGKVFEITGVDLAGPLHLKTGEKCWIVLFTCAIFRCTHLEIVHSLSTEAFIDALGRFVCRRGRPEVIWSDNGTNFHGANNAFKRIDWSRVEKDMLIKRIQWKFIPPAAAWWGGWWERLIRIMKDLLKRILGHKKINYWQLQSILCEVEYVMNSRPLTYVSENDHFIPLTPQMFLTDLSSTFFPETELLEADRLRNKHSVLKKMREELKQRFRSEYLSQLIQRGKEKPRIKLNEDDLVLIGDEQKKRTMWQTGRISKLFPGKDGHSRVAEIQTAHGIIVRAVQKLYPLEVRSHELVSFRDTADISEVAKTTRIGRIIKPPARYN